MREQMPMYLLALALGQRSWGLPEALVARQGQPCALCACNCFRVFIGIGGQHALGIWHLASSPHLWPSESYLIHFISFFFFSVSIKVGFLDYNSEPCMVCKAKLNGGKIALGNSLCHTSPIIVNLWCDMCVCWRDMFHDKGTALNIRSHFTVYSQWARLSNPHPSGLSSASPSPSFSLSLPVPMNDKT